MNKYSSGHPSVGDSFLQVLHFPPLNQITQGCHGQGKISGK